MKKILGPYKQDLTTVRQQDFVLDVRISRYTFDGNK